MTRFYLGDRVVMVDRYGSRRLWKSERDEFSTFNGKSGTIVQLVPFLMVYLDDERLPMRFDDRDFVREESAVHMVAGE